MGRKLTARQRRFVTEYLIDLNGAQAALRAGYSPLAAKVAASQNLTKPNVQAALAEAIKTREQAAEVNQQWVLSKLKENAIKAMEENQRGVANRALELLGKHLGMFQDTTIINQDNRVQSITYQVVYDPPPGEKTTLAAPADEALSSMPALNDGKP
jgi:phage terminase small subunit